MPQAQSVAIPQRIPLVLEPENRSASTAYDARLVNAYMETRPGKDGGVETWIYQRPGLSRLSQPTGGSATGRGCYNWKGNVYSVFNGTLYKDTTSLGSVSNAGQYRFQPCLGGTPRLTLGNGTVAYNYDSGSGLVQITDVDFQTPFVQGWSYLDGTTYNMTSSASIGGDDINNPAAWDPLNRIVAQIEPDGGMALAKQLVYVIALKEWTTEFFFNAQNSSGSPLGPAQNMKLNQGCASGDSVQDVEGNLMWLSANRAAGKQIAQLTDARLQIVSTRPVDRLLRDLDTTTIYSWWMTESGHDFYGVTSTVSNLTLVYDLTERMWSQWTDKNGNYFPISGSTFYNGKTVLQHASNGRLYYCNNDYALDDTDIIRVDMYTPNFDGGTRRRKQNALLGVVADRVAGSILQLRVNDDDYSPTGWSQFMTLDLSQEYPVLSDMGTFIRRAHHFRHACQVRMPRIKAVELQLDIGTI